jgi:D-glycero-D-manno-heptose 1,7-bisphosphate phosphatase
MGDSAQGRRPAIFLDRDGTINVERGYVTRPDDLELIEGAARAVRRINEAGLLAVVVSNQSGVARGLMTEDDLSRVHERLEELLLDEGARLDGAYYCPNYAGGTVARYTRDVSCRKPARGMIDAAVRELEIDLPSSVMVGDHETDIALANAVGIPGVLVETGRGASTLERAATLGIEIAHAAPDLPAAVDWILSDHPAREGGGR